MTTKRTFYDVLGITRHASAPEIQRAHRALAQLLHPDHLASVSLSKPDRALAEQRIREINAAWAVLGDVERRARYDATLGPEEPQWVPPWAPTEGDWILQRHPTTYAQPRRPPPRPASVAARPARPFRWIPIIIVGMVLMVFIVLVALLVGESKAPSGLDPNSPRAGVCVRIMAGPRSAVVDCGQKNDGRIVGFGLSPSDCPSGTRARRLNATDVDLACLVSPG